MKKERAGKGAFGEARLGTADQYPRVASSRGPLFLGAALSLVALLVFAGDLWLGGGELVSNGPLSSDHANLEADCAACHDPALSVTSERCSVCHEKYGDVIGVYSYPAHYLYRSADFRRLVPSPKEESCNICHVEHEGREARMLEVADARCLVCHDFESFNGRHPDFPEDAEERPGLRFGHVQHLREVMKREALVDLEKACLHCHSARPDGTGFQPISFDRHCDHCHLTTAVATPRMPIRGEDSPGVQTLQSIQEEGEPGSDWSRYLNPSEFREAGGRVMKLPLHHRDPWVLWNLRSLRGELYEGGGLADLLEASPEAAPHEVTSLYEEAVQKLESYSIALRGRPEPEIQAELERVDAALEQVRRRLRDPLAPLDETRFELALGSARPELTPERIDALEELVGQLTLPCQRCHLVEKATIVRVQADQERLRRAEFNHRAHILQLRCLDCHHRIAIEELLPGQEKIDPSQDHSGIVNLPGITTCRQCHNESLASQACITCHLFHPNKERRSQMLLYFEEAEGET